MKGKNRKLHEYRWAYLSALLLICFIWWGIFSYVDQVKDNQRVTIAVYNSECDTQILRDHLIQKLPELTQQSISELYVDACQIQIESDEGKKLLSMQVLQADLLIFPESMVEKMDVSAYFPPIPENLSISEDARFYEVNGEKYGILLSGEHKQSLFGDYCDDTQEYYLFLSEYSANLAAIFDRGNAEDDAALALLRYLHSGRSE